MPDFAVPTVGVVVVAAAALVVGAGVGVMVVGSLLDVVGLDEEEVVGALLSLDWFESSVGSAAWVVAAAAGAVSLPLVTVM
jgi:hypothetical protein